MRYPILILLLFVSSSIFAQDHLPYFYKEDISFSPYFMDNPAFLNDDPMPELFSSQTSFSHTEGAFRSFLSPECASIYRQSLKGKKRMGGNKIFKGEFAYIRSEREHNLLTKDTPFGMPFIIGDKDMGSQEYDGLFLSSEFSSPSFHTPVTWGFSLNYYVDDGVKDDFPHPTANHNKISFNCGIKYDITSSINWGLSSRFYGSNEEISYAEDKSKARIPEILKYYDFTNPAVFEKNSETRVLDEKGYKFGTSLQLMKGEWKSSTFLSWESKEKDFKDNGSNPYSSGKWENDQITFSQVFHFNLPFFSVNPIYSYTFQNPLSEHSQYSIKTADIQEWGHLFLMKFSRSFSDTFAASLNMGARPSGMDFYDAQGRSHWKLDNQSIIISPEIRYLTAGFAFSIGYVYTRSEPDLDFNQTNQEAEIFYGHTLFDYYNSETQSHKIEYQMTWNSIRYGIYNLCINYETRKVSKTQNQSLENKTRNYFSCSLEILLDIY